MDRSRSAPAADICPPAESGRAGAPETGAPAAGGSDCWYGAVRLRGGAGADTPAAAAEPARDVDSGDVNRI